MTLPTFVDLRSNYEQVYDQGWEGSCGPHSITAALDCMFERATGKAHRFDKYYIWSWCKMFQGVFTNANVGINFDGAEKALRMKGATLYEQETPITGFRIVRSQLTDDHFADIKRRLASGVPTMWGFRVGSGFDRRNDGKPWREHTWGSVMDWQYQHLVCIVGYDDAAGRWLIENSWGTSFGDGGFFGVPYEQFLPMSEEWWHFDQLPIKTTPESYTMPIPVMLTVDRAAFADRATAALTETLLNKMGEGVPALISECVKWGVSDKHLEALAGWQRGSVRSFKLDNPGLNWDGFIWDQL